MYSQPKSPSGVLTDTLSMLAGASRRLTALGLLVIVPTGAISLLVFSALGPDELLTAVREPLPAGDGAAGLVASYVRAVLLALAAQAIGFLFVLCGTHLIVAAEASGEAMSVAGAARTAASRFPAALVVALVVFAPVSAAVVAGVTLDSLFALIGILVAASWLVVSASMSLPALMIESVTPVVALRRSFELIRGRRLQTLSFLSVIAGLGTMAILLIQLVAVPLVAIGDNRPWLVATAAVGVVFQGILVAFLGAPVTAWYLDLRARSSPPAISAP